MRDNACINGRFNAVLNIESGFSLIYYINYIYCVIKKTIYHVWKRTKTERKV